MTAWSVAEAKEKALDALGVSEEDAEFVIVHHGHRRFFGLLRSEARVRARVRPVRPRPKADRRDRRRRSSSK
jgi:spoIIIJ-associated protein